MGISIEVPGWQTVHIKAVVFDLNGTLTVDGEIQLHTAALLQQLSQKVSVYVLTADTLNSSAQIQEQLGGSIKITVLSGAETTSAKRSFVQKLGPTHTAAVGNGANDIEMLEEAALGIAVLGEEGCSVGACLKADLLVRHINDAVNILLKPQRLAATLRR